MRKAFDKIGQLYQTQLGQDILETGTGAALSAAGQALFTDMTPEEILLSTGIGIGAASVGRPLMGRTGQMIGERLDKNDNIRYMADDLVKKLPNIYGDEMLQSAMKAKMAPYAHLSPSAQLGQMFGRGYGDNVMQGLVALAAPNLMPKEDEE